MAKAWGNCGNRIVKCKCDKCGIEIRDNLCSECRDRLLDKHGDTLIHDVDEAHDEALLVDDMREAGF